MAKNEKNLCLKIIADCDDDKADKAGDYIEKILNRVNADTWIYSITVADGCTFKFFAPHDIDFEFIGEIIKNELGDHCAGIFLETFEGEEIDKIEL